ncbi:MAG: isoprenoid biosynthesis glyoxalase ElbB [Phycisphaerales bacterium]
MKPIAVVIAGSGRGDGTEITEAVSVLVHLSRLNVMYKCFAPDQAQVDVINHVTGKPMSETRNLMVEAARISRGEISDIKTLNAGDFAGVIFPGGFGAAKNLCTFAKDGAACSVHPQVDRVVREFHAAKKPIGLICISPVIGAKVLGTANGGPGCSVTLGNDAGAAQAVTAMGSKHVVHAVTDAHVDREQRVVTTPAYMCEAKPYEVYTGIGKLVEAVVAMA